MPVDLSFEIATTEVTNTEYTAFLNAVAKADPNTCGNPTLPDQLAAIVQLGVACAETSAKVAGGNPSATGTGTVASLGLDEGQVQMLARAVKRARYMALLPYVSSAM